MKRIFSLLIIFFAALIARGNNVQITGVSSTVNGGITTVNFSISWENSWRGGPANNNDAVWVFMKYYDDNNIWQPLRLTGNNITTPSNLIIDVSSDKAGCFISRSTDGGGNIATSTVSVGIQQQPGAFDVKVFGLEMVYIPQGPFWAGYNNATGAYNYGDGSSLAPLQIISAFPPSMGASSGQLWDPRGTGTLNSNFPTGFNAYYMMKYELSQAGYRDFLNSISYNNSNFLTERSDLNGTNYLTLGTKLFTTGVRNNLKVRSSSIITGYVGADANNNATTSAANWDEANDGEWTACGSLFWSDAAAFLDWACLRPMTELEYEKAANGPEAQPFPRFATGTYIVPPTGAVANSNTSAESQVRTSVTNYINTSDGTILGPLRSGYAADGTSDRKRSGGSFYGVMDLSGNLWEYCVTTANAAGRSFKGNVGDGVLSVTEGRANQNSWPGVQAVVTVINGAGEVLKDNLAGIGMKGGSFVDGYGAAVTSVLHDPNTQTVGVSLNRLSYRGYGCRGVRQL